MIMGGGGGVALGAEVLFKQRAYLPKNKITYFFGRQQISFGRAGFLSCTSHSMHHTALIISNPLLWVNMGKYN
jgi:hypothetical protein